MTSPEPVAYLFYGEDEPRLREHLEAFLGELGDPEMISLNTTRLSGESAQLGDIQTASGTLPFLSDVRLTLVENLTETNNGRALLDHLPGVLADVPEWSRLVFVEVGLQTSGPAGSPAERKRKSVRQQALRKLISLIENDPRGRVFAFDAPRDFVSWITDRAVSHGAAIEPDAARELAARLGGDLSLADVELEKLATYAGGERPITVEDVHLLTPYSPEANIFQMVDALGQRNGQMALRLLRHLLDEGDEPLRIFGMIVRQYRLLIQMREHLDEGGSVNSAPQALGIHSFVARKMAQQSRRYGMATLERIYRFLLEIDLEIKSGRVEPELALEMLVTRLAGRG